MSNAFYSRVSNEISNLKSLGKYKSLRYLTSSMSGTSNVENYGDVIMMCSNNYIGLSDKEEVKQAAIKAIEKYGNGASSVRFICGTFDIHRELEENTARLLGTEAALTYTSCWAANTAVIPALLKDGDAVISDELNHASIIDGCRAVSKGVKKMVYKHSNMESLEEKLIQAREHETVLIVTDGVFSMEGDIAFLPEIMELAKKYNALVMIDESHATGVIGKTGMGTCEYYGIDGVDIISGTYGKALGGAGGGFIAAKKDVIDLLIQNSRPSLFSNSLPPVLCAIANESLLYLEKNPQIVSSLKEKVTYMREKLVSFGLKPLEGDSAIIPIIVGETADAIKASNTMMEQGLYTIGFGFPVVPEGEARIRLQISDSLTYENLDKALEIIKSVLA